MINKTEDQQSDCGLLLKGIVELDSNKLDVVIINGVPFKREHFLFKSSGKFNHSKAVELFSWQYHRDILESFTKEG